MNDPICNCQVKPEPCTIMAKRTFLTTCALPCTVLEPQRVSCFAWISVSIENLTAMTSVIVVGIPTAGITRKTENIDYRYADLQNYESDCCHTSQ